MPALTASYRLLPQPPDLVRGPLADEPLLTLAASGPICCLWQAPPGLVVPRTYRTRPGFLEMQARFEQEGWPVHVRQSGGGVVPQGPGILNLSLAQRFCGRPLDYANALYAHLCQIIQAALRTFHIDTRAQAVEGSFCDGRYNLALLNPIRKVAGTAQVWRRAPGGDPDAQIGLVHALILAQCDTRALTAQANRLEAALASGRRYDANKVASLHHECPTSERSHFACMLEERLSTLLENQTALPQSLT
ncbi:MAG TPA: lipoate--protein ligase family protein [Castellaniella sp.]|uniref:lipoyl protein ligase domain-containing protein n=1 Tax=Castellaniella sp. TaxID=1955812 RepID=UPI002F1873FC